MGKYFDKETGTIYLRARYYNPRVGRFTTADSYLGKDNDPLSLNLYTYCSSNPVNLYDPSGHMGVLSWEDATESWVVKAAIEGVAFVEVTREIAEEKAKEIAVSAYDAAADFVDSVKDALSSDEEDIDGDDESYD